MSEAVTLEAVMARLAAVERQAAAALDQARQALAAADRSVAKQGKRALSFSVRAIRQMGLAEVRPSVIAAVLNLSIGNVSQQLCIARKEGLPIPRFAASRQPATAGEISRARKVIDDTAVPDGFVRAPFNMRRSLTRLYKAGQPDPLFAALARAHPFGPPFDVVPSREDAKPMRITIDRSPLFSATSSSAALAAEMGGAA